MKCFICREGEVLGPFTDSEITSRIDVGDLVWMPGVEKDWLTKSEWQNRKTDIKPAAKKTLEWYYAIEGKRSGPMPKVNMIEALLKLKSIEHVMVWNKNLDNWKSVFDFQDIVFAVGHENRQNPRVSIRESLVLTVENEEGDIQSIICAGISLSSEGIGVEGLSSTLKSGQSVDLNLNFLQPDLRIRCSVINTNSADKTANLKFLGLQQEAKSLVLDFIQQRIEEATLNAA